MNKNKKSRPGDCSTRTAVENGTACETAHDSTQNDTTTATGRQTGISALLMCGAENAIPLRQLKQMTGLPGREFRRRIEPLIALKAKERQVAAQNNNAGKSVRENSHELDFNGRTDETLAKISGVSSNTIRRAKIIKNQGTPEQIERARSGKSPGSSTLCGGGQNGFRPSRRR